MPSTYNSGFELCERLTIGGFCVTLACNLDISSLKAVDQYNFVWLRSDHDLRELASEYRTSISASSKWTKRLKMFAKQRQLRRLSLHSPEIENLLATVGPDLLVIDIECHKAIIQSRKADIPTILCSRWFSVFRRPNIPPLHSTLIPDNKRLTNFLSWHQWTTLILRKYFLRLRQFFSVMRFYPITYRNIAHTDLKQLATYNNLNSSLLFESNGWLIPHLYKNIPIVSMVPEELDFDNAAAGTAYLGPVVPEHNHAFSIPEAVLDEVDTFIQVSQRAKRSIIYFSLGTYLKADSKLVEILHNIVSNRSDLALIIGLGGLPVPDNNAINHDKVLYLESAPQINILKVADMAILHAGIGSLLEALKHAVPSIIFSVRTNDQNGCAARMKHHQLGYVLDIETIDISFLENKIDALLNDSELKKKLLNISALLQTYQQPNETLDRFLSVCPDKVIQAIHKN